MAKKKKHFLTNKELLAEIIRSKEQGKMSDELAKMFTLLVKRYAKSPQFAGYSYREDMEAFALMMLVRTWDKFDENRSSNPFAWTTQCVKNSFIHVLKKEKRHRNIRDEMLISQGLNPSNTFILEHEERMEQERHTLQDEIEDNEEKEEPLYE